jgi:hypothetical protein
MALTRIGGAVKSDRIFDTVADMVASKTVKIGDIVTTAGYYSSGDGGGAKYEIVAAATGTDDGGSYIDLDSLQAKLLHHGEIKIKWFGVSTSNTPAQNTTKMQAAFDYGSTSQGVIFNMQDGGFVIDGHVTLKGIGTVLYSEFGRGRVNNWHIKQDSGSTDTKVLHIAAPAATIKGLTLLGRGATVSGTYCITAEEGYDGVNNGDIDLYAADCEIGNAETCVKISGRGFYADHCDFTLLTNVLEIDWPGTSFVEGPNTDQKLVTGFRAYRLSNCRIHAASDGYIVTNNGSNKDKMNQFLMTGCFSDATIRIWNGEMHNAVISGNQFIYLNTSSAQLFNLSGGSNSLISDNYFSGMQDDGYGNTREFIGVASLTNCTNMKFLDNEYYRVNKDGFVINSGCSDISIKGGTFREFCLANDTETRYPIRVAAAIDGLKVENLQFVNSSTRTNDTYIIGNVGSVAITNCYREGNSFDTSNWTLDNIIEADKQGSHSTFRRFERVTGDGGASQIVTLPFEPLFVIVNCLSGANIGETRVVCAFSGTGSGEVDIVNNTVEMKGIFNTNTVIYSVVAFI